MCDIWALAIEKLSKSWRHRTYPIRRYFREWEKGKFNFDHHFAFLTNFLKIQNFLLSGILFGSSRGSFSKNNLSITDLPFRFCKIGLTNTLFIFGRKNGRLLFCLFRFVCCNFVRFWLTFFKNRSTHRAEKDSFKETIIRYTVWELLNP